MDFNQIYEFLVFIFVGWSLLAICSILIVLNSELSIVDCLNFMLAILKLNIFCAIFQS